MITAHLTADPPGVINDSILTLASYYPGVPIVGAVATLTPTGSTTYAGSILLASGGTTLSMTSTSLATLPGLISSNYGRWLITNGFPATPQVFTYISCAGGTVLMPSASMPISGTKTYTVKMTGVLENPPSSGANDVSGDVSLTFDFASGTLSGGQVFTNIITTPALANISIPAFGGSIVGNSFSAAITTPTISGATTRIINGNFFGANADEVAGTFTISDPSPAPGFNLIGSFGAR